MNLPLRASLSIPIASFLAAALLLGPPAVRAADPPLLRLNEVMSNNQNTQPLDEDGDYEDMIELFNPGDVEVILTGLRLTDTVVEDEGKLKPVMPWVFPETVPPARILPRNFVLVYCDGDDKVNFFGEAHTSFRLDQDGELVALFTADDTLIDMIVFPRIPQGTSFGRQPDGAGGPYPDAASLCHMPIPTFRKRSIFGGGPGAENRACGNLPPEVNLRSYDSISQGRDVNPASGAPLPLVADTWDEKEDGVTSAHILFRVNGGEETAVAMERDGFLDRPDPLHPTQVVPDPLRIKWKGAIPGQPAGSVVTFTLRTADTTGAPGKDPRVICIPPSTLNCSEPYRYKVGHEYAGPLVLNEVMPLNLDVIVDTTDFRNEDYFELCSPADLPLEGLWLSNSPFQPKGWMFGPGSAIRAGERLLIWCDNDSRATDPLTGEYHTSFALAAEGEGVFIFDREENGLGLVDALEFAVTPADLAWSRLPDCSRASPFVEEPGGSPRKENGLTPVVKFIRGDADHDGKLQVTDPIVILSHLFLGGAAPACPDAADLDDSGNLNVTDPIWLMDHLFLGGPQPALPFPDEGEDPTGNDSLGCP